MSSPNLPVNGRAHSWIRGNILGLVAIFIALSGSAVAANVASDGGDAQTAAKKKKKPKPKPIPGPAGPAGPQGAPGAPGSALAFAHVAADGTLDTANSKSIAASVQTAQPGYYCVTPSVPVRNMVASADTSAGGGNADAAASLTDNFTSCPDGAVVVTTFDGATGALESQPFYLILN